MTNQTVPTPVIAPRIYRGKSQAAPGEAYPKHLVAMYDFMEAYKSVNGYPPSNREMVDNHFATSTSVIRFYYDRMVMYGMIEVTPGIARGIRLHPKKEWKKHAKVQIVTVAMEVSNEHV